MLSIEKIMKVRGGCNLHPSSSLDDKSLDAVFALAMDYVSLVERVESIKCGPFFFEQTTELVEAKNIGYMRAIRTIKADFVALGENPIQSLTP